MTNTQMKFGKTLRQKIDSGHDREKIEKKYGKEAFLLPEKRKFPIINPNTGNVSCKMLRAAKVRAAQYGYRDVERKASLMFSQKCI